MARFNSDYYDIGELLRQLQKIALGAVVYVDSYYFVSERGTRALQCLNRGLKLNGSVIAIWRSPIGCPAVYELQSLTINFDLKPS